MNSRDHINYVKSELRNYMYLLNVKRGYENKILEIETWLEGIRSSSAPIMPGGGSKDEARQNLLNKLQQNQAELAIITHRCENIENFLESLSPDDCKIVTDVYILNVTIEKTAVRFYCSEKKLRNKIDDVIKKYGPIHIE